MLSYRHIYHAGNHADVLKHFCLYHILCYYNQKAKPYVYIDTHAGTAFYDLNCELATKNQEFNQGIEALKIHRNLAEPIQAFVDFINGQNVLPANHYLGSVGLAALLLRQGDQLRLFERHRQDYPLLERNIELLAPQARPFLTFTDGYQGLIASLPPHTKRAVTLIDPAYEVKEEYAQVPSYLQQALRRFPQGCYIIWSPLLSRGEPKQLITQLKNLVTENYLHVSLSVSKPAADGFGMFGSQLFIVNPPYVLPELLQSAMPPLVQLLAQDEHASYDIDDHLT